MRKFYSGFAVVSLLFLIMGSATGFHTTGHFCEQCAAENCSTENSGGGIYLDCVAMACGDECLIWAADRVDAGSSCMSQCEEMLDNCWKASEGSGDIIDDYCVETGRSCYASCEDDPSNGVAP